MASIKDLGNNRYRVIISDKYDIKGKRKRVSKTFTAKSMRDAEKQATLLEAEVLKGKVEYSNHCTFAELVGQWRNTIEPEMAEKTQVRYEGILKSFMLPAFSRKRVKDIQPLQIQNYLAELKKDKIRIDGKAGGYSPKTIKHHYTLFSSIFNYAVAWKIISENPCQFVKTPKVPKTDAKYYQMDQVEKLLECLERAPIKYKTFVHVALFTGCRRSELMGLEWKDLDFSTNVFKICRTSQYTKKTGIDTKENLKDGSASRIVTVPQGTVDLLKEYKAYQTRQRLAYGKGWVDSDRLFIQQDGKPMSPDTPYQWFEEFLKKNGLPKITIHQLRHTNISIMIYQGNDLAKIAAEKGHNLYTMLNTYAHVMRKAYDEGAIKLDEAFYKKVANRTENSAATK